jgi:hypothetical protein
MGSTKDQLACLKAATDALAEAQLRITLAMRATEVLRLELQHRLETGVEQPPEGPLQPLPLPTVPISEHRREHRPGRPHIIPTDPALQAFITARLDRMTFAEIAADVARHFPPDRQVKKSSIHTWWQSTRKASNRNPGRPPDHSG